eukprot:227243-Chlamydomonas_euryale.AAC.9
MPHATTVALLQHVFRACRCLSRPTAKRRRDAGLISCCFHVTTMLLFIRIHSVAWPPLICSGPNLLQHASQPPPLVHSQKSICKGLSHPSLVDVVPDIPSPWQHSHGIPH